MSRHELSGQIALVTGAASGIGRATALALAEAGATVVVNHRGPADSPVDVVDEIRRQGGTAVAESADVSSEAAVQAMFARVVERFGTLHILVNNAGLQRDAPSEQLSLADWRTVIDVNLTGQFLCARAAIREYLRRGVQPERSPAAGKIVCISSVHEHIPWAGHANYAASKGGVKLLVQTLAQEFAGRRIRVNGIAPGAIRTPINRAAWETDTAMADLLSLIPYGRIGAPRDVAQAALWLTSDDSDYVTGTTLIVDGGMSLYPGFGEGGG